MYPYDDDATGEVPRVPAQHPPQPPNQQPPNQQPPSQQPYPAPRRPYQGYQGQGYQSQGYQGQSYQGHRMPPPPPVPPPWWKQRVLYVVAGAFLGVILLATAGWALIDPGDGKRPVEAAGGPTTSASA